MRSDRVHLARPCTVGATGTTLRVHLGLTRRTIGLGEAMRMADSSVNIDAPSTPADSI